MQTRTRNLLGVIEAVLLAVTSAVLGTVAHQTIVGGFPFGLLVGLLLITATAIHLRHKYSKLPSLAFAITFALVIFWAGQSSNQDKLIPATDLGYLWGYGSIALAALFAMWPRITKGLWTKKV